jgi:sugar/nucleoside kinase (ribokinase family)
MDLDALGLGVSTVDLLTLVEEFPAREGNRRALDQSLQGGGPVATAMAAMARLGGRVGMIDAVGSDWRSRVILEEFDRCGVSTAHIRRLPEGTCALSCVLVRQTDGLRSIIWYPGSVPELGPDDLAAVPLESAPLLHLNGRHLEACLSAAARVRRAGGRVSFDGGAHRYRAELRRLIPLSDICIVAREFGEASIGESDPARAAEALAALGPSLVGVTDGVRGSWIRREDGSILRQPAFRVPIVDTTGCGDCYHGAFLFGLARGLPLEQTARLASAAAALNARALGGRAGLPTLAQVEAFLSSHPPEYPS